ncbi:glycosyl transferase family 4 [Natrinema hispanicum]|uniref:Glycosyl transferase family 4 n=1 Tax=Natrinema hispanicum TaxID=392421 RepID=A0A482Y7V5_9EURY|nr:glycosyltransferase [Natrinema hispanicum]RZV10814.1 glycosyl transferase family 4 [Natrinema hispanicum]
MNVLNLTSKSNSPPFELQIQALEERGIDCTTVSVPGMVTAESGRSVLDYVRFYPTVLTESLGSYDLVHANYGLTAPFALAQPRLPVVLSLWGTDLDGELGWVSKRCAPYCDATIVMSEQMKRELGQDCHVIPHGVDFDIFEPMSQSDAIDRLGWDPDANHVLFPYKKERTVKNYPRAARIVDAVRDDVSEPVHLQTAREVPHAEMSTYMNAADCLLLTSDREGSPNVVKEALACNLPVVSVDVGDVRERLEGVTPSSVCRTDAELRRALATILTSEPRSNGREQAEKINMEWMAARIHDVYRDVVDH